MAERKFKDLLKKKQSTWTPGEPGRPPAWAAEYVQKRKEDATTFLANKDMTMSTDSFRKDKSDAVM